MTVRISAPMTTPSALPRPPESGTPPITTAAIEGQDVAVADGRRAAGGRDREIHSAQGRQQAADDIGAELHLGDPNAAQARRGLVAAERAEMEPETGPQHPAGGEAEDDQAGEHP